MKILDFFDIYNIDHLDAYLVLNKTGTWPEDFLPKNITFCPAWQIGLAGRMALAWAEHDHLGIGRDSVE